MDFKDQEQAPYIAPTQIPDQAVLAAMSKVLMTKAEAIDALAAALPYLTASVEVGELDWQEYGERSHKAETPLGRYAILAAAVQCYRLDYPDENTEFHNTLEEAKAAAQVDFDRRILSQIVTKPVDVAVVREKLYREAYEDAVTDALNICRKFDDISLAEIESGIKALQPDPKIIRALSPAEPVGQWQDMKALSELSKLTYAIQHNPNCPDKYLVRLPGNGGIDLKPYGNVAFRTLNQTNDILGFGKTLHEAYIAATAAPTSKGGE